MNKRALSLVGLVAIIVAILVVAERAKPQPLPLPQSSSVQPKITWSANSLEMTLSPRDNSIRDVSFTSDTTLPNAVVQAVPELAGFLTINPSALANLPADQPQTVRLSFSIPQLAALGTYAGTIHVRSDTKTLPETLKLTLNVWQRFTVPWFGYTVRFPEGWTIAEVDSRFPSQANPNQNIKAYVIKSAGGSTFSVLPEGEFDYGLDPDLQRVRSSVTVDSRPATRIDHYSPLGILLVSVIRLNQNLHFRLELRPVSSTEVATLNSILSSFNFQ